MLTTIVPTRDVFIRRSDEAEDNRLEQDSKPFPSGVVVLISECVASTLAIILASEGLIGLMRAASNFNSHHLLSIS